MDTVRLIFIPLILIIFAVIVLASMKSSKKASPKEHKAEAKKEHHGHGDHGHAPPSFAQRAGGWLEGGVGLLFFAIVLVGGGQILYWLLKSEKPVVGVTASFSITPAQTGVVAKKVGQSRTLYKFADFPNGCAVTTDPLTSDASFYPKGGAVMIHPPQGEPWEDSPGVLTNREGTTQPAGRYMVCKKHPDSWGVEIWN